MFDRCGLERTDFMAKAAPSLKIKFDDMDMPRVFFGSLVERDVRQWPGYDFPGIVNKECRFSVEDAKAVTTENDGRPGPPNPSLQEGKYHRES